MPVPSIPPVEAGEPSTGARQPAAEERAAAEPTAPAPGTALLCVRPGPPGEWWRFTDPVQCIRASRLDEVRPALVRVAEATQAGFCAVGFLSYEAAPAFDAALTVRPPAPGLALLQFNLYRGFLPVAAPAPAPPVPLPWASQTAEAEYRAAVTRIRACIAAGDTYQVNYTQRLRAPFAGDPWQLFRALAAAQPGSLAAYLDVQDTVLCSVSPELFFHLEGERILTRPMKGTAPRGLTQAEDRRRRAWLAASEKNRAENLMIVDMLRNDLGRIARCGSVRVPRLFSVERYDTVWQMTSTVAARTGAPLDEIVAALFPCASITGAPKVRTMQIIAELEPEPRGVYCGAIGYVLPGRRAQFSVGIRTVACDRARGVAEYGTGGGIVWDSEPTDEWEECRTKARVLAADGTPFQLLETILWRPRRGLFLAARHLLRLAESAAYFGFRCDLTDMRRRLRALAGSLPQKPQRIRLLLGRDGSLRLEAGPLPPMPPQPWRVGLAPEPVDAASRFLYHKTTRRQVYDRARAARPDCDDVLLWNRRGEITESTIANVAVRHGRVWTTPPVACGLLAGVYRAHWLARGGLREGIVTRASLEAADAICLFNSLRGRVRARLVPAAGHTL